MNIHFRAKHKNAADDIIRRVSFLFIGQQAC